MATKKFLSIILGAVFLIISSAQSVTAEKSRKPGPGVRVGLVKTLSDVHKGGTEEQNLPLQVQIYSEDRYEEDEKQAEDRTTKYEEVTEKILYSPDNFKSLEPLSQRLEEETSSDDDTKNSREEVERTLLEELEGGVFPTISELFDEKVTTENPEDEDTKQVPEEITENSTTEPDESSSTSGEPENLTILSSDTSTMPLDQGRRAENAKGNSEPETTSKASETTKSDQNFDKPKEKPKILLGKIHGGKRDDPPKSAATRIRFQAGMTFIFISTAQILFHSEIL